MTQINQLMKFVIANKAIIRDVYVFDTTQFDHRGKRHEITGVEISLIDLNEHEFKYPDSSVGIVHVNHFSRAKGYLYLALADKNTFEIWVAGQIEGRVCKRVCEKFGYFQSYTPTDEERIAARAEAEAKVYPLFPEYQHIINNQNLKED